MKKRILLIIVGVMVISTLIRSVILGYSFFGFSENLIKNEGVLLREIVTSAKNKESKKILLDTIRKSSHIKNIHVLPNSKNDEYSIAYEWNKKEIKMVLPLKDKGALDITFEGKYYFDIVTEVMVKILFIGLISMIIITYVINYFLNPYIKLLEDIRSSTHDILKGNFDKKIETELEGETKEFVETYNSFLEKLSKSLGVIEEKYKLLINKQNKDRDEDPLNEAKITIEYLVDIFNFKRLIEDDRNIEEVLNRFIDLLTKNFKVENLMLIGIDNNTKKIFSVYKNVEDVCCNVLEDVESCRTYRTQKEVECVGCLNNQCLNHHCKDINYVCLPFSLGGNFTGILKILAEEQKKEYIKEILPYIKAYLNEISPVVEAKYTLKLLHEQTMKDPMLNLHNRRFLEDVLDKIIAASKRKEEKIGFMMIDLDHFKQINDVYGHKAGDIILQELAAILKNNIRASDFIIRYGGEEFLIVFQDVKSLENLIQLAEKIRKKVAGYNFFIEGKVIKKTVSIGLSLYPDQCASGWNCIKQADVALYSAKNGGRNQVVVYQPGMKIKKEENSEP